LQSTSSTTTTSSTSPTTTSPTTTSTTRSLTTSGTSTTKTETFTLTPDEDSTTTISVSASHATNNDGSTTSSFAVAEMSGDKNCNITKCEISTTLDTSQEGDIVRLCMTKISAGIEVELALQQACNETIAASNTNEIATISTTYVPDPLDSPEGDNTEFNKTLAGLGIGLAGSIAVIACCAAVVALRRRRAGDVDGPAAVDLEPGGVGSQLSNDSLGSVGSDEGAHKVPPSAPCTVLKTKGKGGAKDPASSPAPQKALEASSDMSENISI